MASEKRSEIRNKSGLKKKKSNSGGSLFSCTKGQQDDSSMIDEREHKLRLITLENEELQKQNKELMDVIKTMVEQMEKTVILQNCKNVMFGDDGVIKVEETIDTKKLDIYTDTVIKTLNIAADDKKMLELTVRRLEETLGSVENKMNVMEAHFSDLTATLTRDFKKAADQLMQHNLDIANQFSDVRTIFQRAQDDKINETMDEEDDRKIKAGINAIRDCVIPTPDVTGSTLPIPARKLHKMLTSKYGKIPVELEMLFTSSSKGYYESSDTFDNTVARWLVGWVRSSADNTADVLRTKLANLNKIVDIVSDSED
ncbi:uncharacterized protein LOC110455323 [Mizuhopecten yessoensis]|uniref:Uncharacterized protein n=1 Tax=Mizuhopecten yessoensis TaxID=6573 RepID=A0A210QDB5_MIZYE|nr:uncharacterized protein LOC110455323 [Mizuhopecten yessoensis]OWF46720.1 hypothetical protein KP79_PYT21217 [Mizuhopecten yessoensis]